MNIRRNGSTADAVAALVAAGVIAIGIAGAVTPAGASAKAGHQFGPAQTLTTNAYSCSGAPVPLFDNYNVEAVDNGGAPPTFTTDGHFCLTSIATYHWDNGVGAAPGSLGLTGIEVAPGFATTVGPLEATGTSGQGGAQDVNWVAYASSSPTPTLVDGTYACQDSEQTSWSPEHGLRGFWLLSSRGHPGDIWTDNDWTDHNGYRHDDHDDDERSSEPGGVPDAPPKPHTEDHSPGVPGATGAPSAVPLPPNLTHASRISAISTRAIPTPRLGAQSS